MTRGQWKMARWLDTLKPTETRMATQVPDQDAQQLVPTYVTTDDDRLRLRIYLERSDLIRIAYAAVRLLTAIDATEAAIDDPRGMRIAPNSREALLMRIRQWAGPVELADLQEPRVGGSGKR